MPRHARWPFTWRVSDGCASPELAVRVVSRGSAARVVCASGESLVEGTARRPDDARRLAGSTVMSRRDAATRGRADCQCVQAGRVPCPTRRRGRFRTALRSGDVDRPGRLQTRNALAGRGPSRGSNPETATQRRSFENALVLARSARLGAGNSTKSMCPGLLMGAVERAGCPGRQSRRAGRRSVAEPAGDRGAGDAGGFVKSV